MRTPPEFEVQAQLYAALLSVLRPGYSVRGEVCIGRKGSRKVGRGRRRLDLVVYRGNQACLGIEVKKGRGRFVPHDTEPHKPAWQAQMARYRALVDYPCVLVAGVTGIDKFLAALPRLYPSLARTPEWHATSGKQVVSGGVRKELSTVQGDKCSEDVTSPGRLTHLSPAGGRATPA